MDVERSLLQERGQKVLTDIARAASQKDRSGIIDITELRLRDDGWIQNGLGLVLGLDA